MKKIKTYEDMKKWADSQPYDLCLEVSHAVTEARVKTGFTQEKLAKKIKTTQSSIARLENGYLPSLSFLKRLADGMGMDVLIKLEKKPHLHRGIKK